MVVEASMGACVPLEDRQESTAATVTNITIIVVISIGIATAVDANRIIEHIAIQGLFV